MGAISMNRNHPNVAAGDVLSSPKGARRARKSLVATAAFTILMGVTACNAEDAEMPDVENSRLDIALSDIERAGFDQNDVEIVGGGMFGVVDESNWQVCEQEPASGELIGSAPRLVVERSCEAAHDNDTQADEAADAPDETEPKNVSAPKKVAEPKKVSKPKKRKKVEQASDFGTFTMPALVGFNLQDAQDVLQSFGSFLLTQTDATGLGRFQVLDSNWKVCYQRPAPGAEVDILKLIELGAVKLEESCP
jgi:hypothetical protein